MAKKHRVTGGQVSAAQAFLRTLGADWHDYNLVLVIIAWGVVASHGLYHNVFKLKPGAWDKGLRTGQYAVGIGKGHHEFFSKYGNTTSAYIALARFLKASPHEYGALIQAIRHARVDDTLFAISASNFDPYHYGLGSSNLLYKAYNSLYLVIPGKKQPGPPPPPKPKPLAPIPQVLQPPTLRNEYLSAYATRDFYRQRHPIEVP